MRTRLRCVTLLILSVVVWSGCGASNGPAKAARPPLDPQVPYRFVPTVRVAPGLTTSGAIITGLGSRGSQLRLKQGGMLAYDGGYRPETLGASDITIEIDPRYGSTLYAGLAFASPCNLSILQDGLVVVDRADVQAKDAHHSWRSRLGNVGGTSAYLMYPAP
jgi:hypothetical protein